MMLRTLAILLSLSAAYSSAAYTFNPDEEPSKASQRIRDANAAVSRALQGVRTADAELAKAMQRIPAEREREMEIAQQVKEKYDALDRELIEASHKLMEDLDAGTMTAGEMTLKFNELNKRIKAEKEAVSKVWH